MVIFVLTKNGFKEMDAFIKATNVPIWVNGGIFTESELEELRHTGVDITNFTYHIDKTNEVEIQGALATIKEHHPGQNIWTEL